MRLSASFTSEEFTCHSGEPVPEPLIRNVQSLCLYVLQPIRDAWGSLIIQSGYRTAEYNKRIHGARTSTHMTAQAADIRPVRYADVHELGELIEKLHREGKIPDLGGLGRYAGWVHVDTRRAPDGHLRRWTGKGVGGEPTS